MLPGKPSFIFCSPIFAKETCVLLILTFNSEDSLLRHAGFPNARSKPLARLSCCLQADKYIDERHRHRYEVNPAYVQQFEAAGLKFVGRDETGERMEIIELVDHPFFVAAQFHPEFKSRPFKPSPLFLVRFSRGFHCCMQQGAITLCIDPLPQP